MMVDRRHMLEENFAASGSAGGVPMSGTTVGAETQLFVSGVGVGDYLSPHRTDADINTLADARAEVFVEGGTGDPVSGVNVGAATQLYISGVPVGDRLGQGGVSDHGGLAGLTDDDHTQYLLTDGTRAALALVSSGGVILDENQFIYFGPSGSASFPAIKRNAGSSDLRVIKGDDSGDTNLYCQILIANDDVRVPAAKAFEFFSRAHLTSPQDGELLIQNAAEDTSGVLRAGSGVFDKQITISGISVGDKLGLSDGVTDHGALNGLLDNDHPQYLLTSDFVSSGEAQGWDTDTQPVDLRPVAGDINPDSPNAHTIGADGTSFALMGALEFHVADGGQIIPINSGQGHIGSTSQRFGNLYANSGYYADQIYISGIAVGPLLGQGGGAGDGSGVGSVTASGNRIYPTDLFVSGQSGIFASVAGSTLTISTNISASSDGSGIGSVIAGGTKTSPSDLLVAGSGGTNASVTGDTLVISGIVNHDQLANLGNDDHAQYLLADGSRNLQGAWLLENNINPLTPLTNEIGSAGQEFAIIGSMEFNVASGGGINTTSGNADIGDSNAPFGTLYAKTGVYLDQVSISGVNVGDYLSPAAGGADGSGVGGIIASGSKITPSDLTVLGASGIYATVAGSTLTISTNITGGSADFSSISEDVLPDASGTRNIGSMQKPWNSGFFNRVMVYSPNGSGWYIDVDDNGILRTTGPQQP
jgi:hypothetical protein